MKDIENRGAHAGMAKLVDARKAIDYNLCSFEKGLLA